MTSTWSSIKSPHTSWFFNSQFSVISDEKPLNSTEIMIFSQKVAKEFVLAKENWLKAGTWVNMVNKIVNLFYSKFRFWTANGWAICQWKKSTLKINIRPDSNLMFFSFIGKWLSHSRFKIWILSKKGVQNFVYQIHSRLFFRKNILI